MLMVKNDQCNQNVTKNFNSWCERNSFPHAGTRRLSRRNYCRINPVSTTAHRAVSASMLMMKMRNLTMTTLFDRWI